jgi:hypothetical protein
MFGLAAVAAVAAMALVGATSAMATSTQACSNDTANAAPTATECGRVTSSHFESVGHLKLVTKAGFVTVTIECDALLAATLPNTLASPLTTSTATLTYSNCLNGCSATVIANGSVSTLNTSVANETSDVTAAGFEVLAECSGLHCVYDAVSLVGKGLGPLKTASGFDEVTYTNAEAHKVEGTLCPETSKLSGVFRDLTKTYLRE